MTKKAPGWWGAFIANVRRTGLVRESLEETRWKGKKLGRTAHIHHINSSEELRLELEAAIKEGTAAIKLARVSAVLDLMREGMLLADALRTCGEPQSRWYPLLHETEMQELYEKITDAWERRRNGYEEAITYADERLASHGADHHLDLLRKVLAACNKPSVELAKDRTGLRNAIIRIIGSEFKDKEDCPPFLKEDADVAQSLRGEGASDSQGV